MRYQIIPTPAQPWELPVPTPQAGSAGDLLGARQATRFGAESDCKGGAAAWVPFIGCDWLAGAREAKIQGQQAAQDWISGIQYLVTVGREDGVMAAIAEYGQGATYAAAVSAQWSAEQVDKLLDQVDAALARYRTTEARTNAVMAQLPPVEAQRLRNEALGPAFAQAQAELADMIGQITAAVRSQSEATQRWGSKTAAWTVGGSFSGVAYGAAPVAITAGMVYAGIAAAALIAIYLINRMNASMVTLSGMGCQWLVANGKLPQDQLGKCLEGVAEGAKSTPDTLAEFLKTIRESAPWIVGGVGLVLAAPALKVGGAALAEWWSLRKAAKAAKG